MAPDLGWLGSGWAVAFAAEYASTRIGIPFGLYYGVVLFNLGITGWMRGLDAGKKPCWGPESSCMWPFFC